MCKKLQNVTKMNKGICKLFKSWCKNNILTAEIGKHDFDCNKLKTWDREVPSHTFHFIIPAPPNRDVLHMTGYQWAFH